MWWGRERSGAQVPQALHLVSDDVAGEIQRHLWVVQIVYS